MSNNRLVRDYLAVATPGQLDLDAIRSFLADDVQIEDPLMSISGADGFIEALRSTGTESGGGMRSTVQDVVGDGDVVAARVLFEMGPMTVQFSQWFWITDGKIARVQVIYDPRAFLERAG
ncbi:MAG: nuclear transport factor 2 family protein [Acidimicrobiia bacterium]|nr:nuclear transport factor 2 family protein [Acidimicrobiia bacterium]